MRKRTLQGLVRTAVLTMIAASVAACDFTVGAAQFSVREEKKFTVTGATTLSLSTFDGSIDVRGSDRHDVLVEVEKLGPDQATVDRIEVKASQNGNVITLDVSRPSPLVTVGFGQSVTTRLVVSVPLQTTVTARSGDGSVTIRRVNGKVDVDTRDGSVRVEDVEGDVLVRSGDGSVQARDIRGTATIDTGDGSVGVEGLLTGLRAETKDGSIEVTARKGSATGTDRQVTTGDGSIRLELPEGFGAELDAHTADGQVTVDRLADAQSVGDSRDREERNSARGRLGAGGRTLKLRSGGGTIAVRTR